MPADEKLLYTNRGAAQLLAISARSLDYLIFNGQLPARRIARRVLIPRDALEQFARLDHATIRPLAVGAREMSMVPRRVRCLRHRLNFLTRHPLQADAR
jgi:excisionase family DNA binding protein